MTNSEKLDLLLAEIQTIKNNISSMNDRMEGLEFQLKSTNDRIDSMELQLKSTERVLKNQILKSELMILDEVERAVHRPKTGPDRIFHSGQSPV